MQSDLSELENARLTLAKVTRDSDPAFFRALHDVLRVAASTLSVARTSIWQIDPTWSTITCRLMFESQTEAFSSGQTLALLQFVAYSDALKERRVIAADDAQSDPRTRELGPDYLMPLNITSMLDCPIYEDGEVVAIVCHEHIGPRRVWTKRDADFAVSVADITATMLAQATKIRFEAALREARESLAEARVMDSLGRMALNVAHDFNNVLSGIQLTYDEIAQLARVGQGLDSAIRDGRSLVDQGARLVKQLLSFAKHGAHDGEPLDIRDALHSMLPRLDRILGVDIRLEASLPEEPTFIAMDLSTFEQVMTNLIVNARDAMRGGGNVTLTLQRMAQKAILTLRDTGLGMEPATCQRVFEPFFSTKGASGNGLGLSIVFGAVKRAGGTVHVESKPGAGTTFTLEFPIRAASGPI